MLGTDFSRLPLTKTGILCPFFFLSSSLLSSSLLSTSQSINHFVASYAGFPHHTFLLLLLLLFLTRRESMQFVGGKTPAGSLDENGRFVGSMGPSMGRRACEMN